MLEDKKFLAARKEFSGWAKERRGGVTAVGFFSNKNGYVVDNNPQCHIGLTRPGIGNIDVIFSGFQRSHRLREDTKTLGQRWFEYQKAHPIWGKGVLNENFEDVYENGWVFDANQPRDTLCSAIFATRWPTEHPEQCRAMFRYVDAGMQPDMAFLLSTISHNDHKSDVFEYAHKSGHMPCAAGAPEEFCRNFLSYQVRGEGVSYKTSPGYSGIDRVFFSGDYTTPTHLRAALSKRVEQLCLGISGWSPTKDIFFTKKAFESLMNKRGKEDWKFTQKELPTIVQSLNTYREEILV